MQLLWIAVVAFVGSVCWQTALAETTSGDVKRETAEALQTTKQYTIQQKNEFEKKTSEHLGRMEKQVDHLKFKAKRAEKDAQSELNQLVGDVEEKRQVAVKKFKNLQATSGRAWNDLRSGVSQAMDDLEHTYQRVVSRFP